MTGSGKSDNVTGSGGKIYFLDNIRMDSSISRKVGLRQSWMGIVMAVTMVSQVLIPGAAIANHDPFNGKLFPDNGRGSQVDLCHRNQGESEYSSVQAQAGAIIGEGNQGHPPDDSHALDIIPPFHYDLNGDGVEDAGSPYPGRNWATGEAIWNNNCTPVVQATGSLTVTKNIVGGSDTTFDFSGTAPIANFQITTTASTGSNTLTGLTPGLYSITEGILPAGWSETSNDCDDISVVAGQTATCTIENTFATPPNTGGSLTGMKFSDLDSDGTLDIDESGLGGWTIYADLDGDATLDAGEPFCITGDGDGIADADECVDTLGWYLLDISVDGTFQIREENQLGWIAVSPLSSHEVTVSGGARLTARYDFANHQNLLCLPQSINGTVFNDLNGNNLPDEGEALEGWKVYIDENDDNAFDDAEEGGEDFMLTDSNGEFVFTGLLPGEYTVRQVPGTGWTQTLPTEDEEREYLVTLDCEILQLPNFAIFALAVQSDGTDLLFANVANSSNGGGGSRQTGSGSSTTPDDSGTVLGDTISDDTGTVLGEQLPVTGMELNLWLLVGLLGLWSGLRKKQEAK